MTRNVGGADRILRILIGLSLIAGFFLDGDATYRWLYLIGIVPLLTGLLPAPFRPLPAVQNSRIGSGPSV